MNLDQMIQIEYAKLCQSLGDVESKIALLKEDSDKIKNKILAVLKSKSTFDSAVQNLASANAPIQQSEPNQTTPS